MVSPRSHLSDCVLQPWLSQLTGKTSGRDAEGGGYGREVVIISLRFNYPSVEAAALSACLSLLPRSCR